MDLAFDGPDRSASHDFRITIGGPDCTKPYSASVLNISAMSFGALSANAIRALNKGAKMGGFAHDTGEGGVHRPITAKMAATSSGKSAPAISAAATPTAASRRRSSPERPATRQIKMIEIKLSQGAKPGHGGVLPAAKITAEIADIRGIADGRRLHLAGRASGIFDAAAN